MSDCCDANQCSIERPDSLECPGNGKTYMSVEFKTVMQQLNSPWERELNDQGYYFCHDPECAVVYFGEDGSLLRQADLRTAIGQKSKRPDRTLCYCFGVTLEDYLAAKPIKDFVIEQTKSGNCSCDIRNPSGRCCLKDFRKN